MENNHNKKIVHGRASGGCGAVYVLGMIGAAIYFIQHAIGFWAIILAILKAIVWPSFVVYELLKGFFG